MLLPIYILLALLLLFVVRKIFIGARSCRLPPGPPGPPLIGNLFQLDSFGPHRHLWRLSLKYGPLFTLKLGFKTTLVASSARMAREIMKTHDLDCCSRPLSRGAQKLSYNGLDIGFSPYNSYWREIRRICVVHLFNPNRVQLYRPIREEEVSLMIRKLSSQCQDPSKHGAVNLSDAMMCLTSAIICRVGFGKRYEDEGTEKSRFHELLNESQAMFGAFFVSDYFPLMAWFDRLTGLVRRLDRNFRELDEFYEKCINEHLDPMRPRPEHEDIIDVLLHLQKSREFSVHLTFDHIKAVLMNVLIAGTDTGAATVIWAMTFLMKNPNSMQIVQEEIRSSVGKKGLVNENDLQHLPYFKAVIKETYRLQPTVPLLLPREVIKSFKIDNYEIPAKTQIFVNAWAIGRDPKIWDNPKEFLPERFIGSSIDYKGLDYELIPFGAGRRGCPGIHMGALTVELALANLLYAFDWEMPPGMNKEEIDFEEIPGITVHKKNVLCLVPKKIIIGIYVS